MTEFLAIDGEAINDKYCLLASSDGKHIFDLDELSTVDCFEFLLQLPKKNQTIVCFGLNYDANMWIRDLLKRDLIELWETSSCVYLVKKEMYRIEWIPAHWFKIEKLKGPSVTIFEVWGFFQSSFVNALKAWGFETQPEMEYMKSQRGEFSPDDIDRVIRYCKSETVSLVHLMNALQAACKVAKIVPRRWLGAGSLAGTMLTDNKWVSNHHVHDEELGPPESHDAIMRGYFGGRVEMLSQGIFKAVQSADIRSAYPYAITHLPSLQDGTLTHRKSYDPNLSHALWRVSWDYPEKIGSVMPFPLRYKGDVYYPTKGSGWYHACEVYTAVMLGYPLTIHEGWVLKNADPNCKPLAWVRKVYDLRNQWKKEGIAAEKVLKLSLNSLYGKFAQGIGYKPSHWSKRDYAPRWQSYFWAGEITARTRARMLEAANKCQQPIMIATDGLFCVKDCPSESFDLGGWEVSSYDSLFVARAGVYRAFTPEKAEIRRTRGFHAREVDWDALEEHYEESSDITIPYRYKSRRFIGLGSALMRKDFSVWRTWEDAPRILSFLPSSKDYDLRTGEISPYSGVLPESEPFIPKGRKDSEEDKIQASEQPLKADSIQVLDEYGTLA